jgi:hypothetical protein
VKLRRVFAWLLLLAALAAIAPVRRWLAADSCLDAGGAFDYAQGRCRHEADLQPVPADGAASR